MENLSMKSRSMHPNTQIHIGGAQNMSLYEDLLLQTQMNYTKYHHLYLSGGTPFQMSPPSPLSYDKKIHKFASQVKDADCIVAGGASGLSAAGSGDFYYGRGYGLFCDHLQWGRSFHTLRFFPGKGL
jgi:hypothetical protein